MKIYNTSGTIGDTYVNCCKLYKVKDKIKLFHSQPYPQFNNLIREIYTLIPNIVEVKICNHEKSVCNPEFPYFYSLTKNCLGEPEEIKMNFFPKFEFKSKYNFKFPYIVLQPKSGRLEQKKELGIRTINKIIKNSKYKVLLIGTSKKYEKIMNCVNLVNKTTIFDSFKIIQNAKYFIGFFGIMTIVALSQKIFCSFVYSTERELDYRIQDTPWEKYCKKVISLEDYLLTEGPFSYRVIQKTKNKRIKKLLVRFVRYLNKLI